MTNLNMTFWMVVTLYRLVGILAEMANMPKQTVRQWIGSFPADGSKTGMVRSFFRTRGGFSCEHDDAFFRSYVGAASIKGVIHCHTHLRLNMWQGHRGKIKKQYVCEKEVELGLQSLRSSRIRFF